MFYHSYSISGGKVEDVSAGDNSGAPGLQNLLDLIDQDERL